MKVIVSAYACSPYKGSEPGVGWGFIQNLTHLHELCVITELTFKEDIERYLDLHPELKAQLRFEYIPRIRHSRIERLWPPSYYWTYRRWHQDAYRLAQQLHQQVHFDLAHQLTMVGFREPGYLWKLGIPFVWGPVGGMGLFPWRFIPTVGLYGAIYYLGYNLLNLLHMRFLARPRRAAQTASDGLIAMNEENHQGLLSYYGISSKICIPVGPPSVVSDTVAPRIHGEALRIVWTGLHIPRKALNLGLEALAQLPDGIVWELHILGEGTHTERWKRLAKSLGIDGHCYFHGWLPREQALKVMKSSHLMLFTSLREGTPTVLTEAFSLALPVICLDCSGMSDMVDKTCGIKVPVTTPGDVIAGLAQAIEQLARNENQRQALAQGALVRARDFAWEEVRFHSPPSNG